MLLQISYPTIVTARGETIWVNAVLCLSVLQYCDIAVLDWILVKDISYRNVGFSSKEMKI